MSSSNPLRAAAAAILLVLGVVLVPATLCATWLKASITNTDSFVAMYAPLAGDPEFQDFLSARVTESAVQAIGNVGEGATATLESVLEDLGLPSQLTEGIGSTTAGAVDAIEPIISDQVKGQISSPDFAVAWTALLRETHTGFISILNGDSSIVTGNDTMLELQIGPLVSSLREQLINNGTLWARLIPNVQMTVPLTEIAHLPQLQVGYQLLTKYGSWLPWLTAALLIGGIVVANKRWRALGWAGAGVAIAAGTILVGLPLVGGAILPAAPAAVVSYSAEAVLWQIGTTPLAQSSSYVAGGGVIIALLGLGIHLVTRSRREAPEREFVQ